MRHDDRMNETEGKTLAQGQGMNVPGETETREEAEMSREKGQDAEEKEAALHRKAARLLRIPEEDVLSVQVRPRKHRRRTRPLTGSWRR